MIPSRLRHGCDGALLSVLALTFASSLADSSIIPVLPRIKATLALSSAETGAILSATTLSMLAASVPIGLLAGRLGTRGLLRASAIILPLAILSQGLAQSLPMLLVARAAYGLSFAILWTIGPTVVAANGRGAAGTGRLIATAGAGWLVGPLLSGVLADAWGFRVPFLVIGTLSLPLVLGFLVDRSPVTSLPVGRLRDALAAARREPAVSGATLATALLGMVTGVSGLVAPLVLARNGLSGGAIGALVTVSAVVWVVGGALSARLSATRIHIRLVGAGAALLAVAWLIPVLSLSTVAMIAFLLASAGCRALLNTTVYALARLAAPSESLAAPIVGILNLSWATTALVAPICAGAAIGETSARWAFFVTAASGFAVAAWTLLPRHGAAKRPSAPAVV